MEKAIKKAIEGGWKYEENSPTENLYKWKVVCDPLFWSSLGKAEGWDKEINEGTGHFQDWGWHWHRFIDHLANGGTVDDFFNNLLK